MAYSILIQKLEFQVANARLMAVTMAAAGASDVEMPEFEEERVRFDEALREKPNLIDFEREQLLRGVGLRR